MPQRKARLSNHEFNEYRARLSQLRDMGVAVGSSDMTADPERLTLRQIYHESASVYEMPGGEVTALVLAKLTVSKPGVVITGAEIFPSWFDWKLDLDDLRHHKSFLEDLTRSLPIYPPRLLYPYLVGRTAPLRRCQLEGIIVATGHSPIPANLQHGAPVSIKLWIRDERGAEFCFNFRARVDQSIMEIRKRIASSSRVGVTKRLLEKIEPDDETGFAPEVPKDQRGIGVSRGVRNYIVERYNSPTRDQLAAAKI